MLVRNPQDLEGIKAAGEAVAQTLKKMREYAAVGMTTLELDLYGKELLDGFGAVSAPKSDYKFPGHTCISINHEACHGIPSKKRVLQEGDLVNIDVSARLNDYYGDNGGSFILGEDIQGLQPLVDASQEILMASLLKVRAGVKINQLGGFIFKEAKARGLEVVRNICGHGIGRKLHEEPSEIPCYYDPYNRDKFKENSVVAIETFISTKERVVHQQRDGWTLATKDGSFVAQHEHTLIVLKDGVHIVTTSNGIG